jgi:hypothetical protein
MWFERAQKPLPIHRDRDQHGLAPDHAVFPHFLVTRIQNHVGVGFSQPAPRELFQFLVQTLIQPDDGRR